VQTPDAAMRPGSLRRVLVVVGCGLLTVTASACQSTEQESAKLGREGGQPAARPAAVKLGAVNHSVRVSDVTLLSSSGRTAVVVRLTATSTRAQSNLPVLVAVTGASGKLLYSNDAAGLEPSLQRFPLLRSGHGEWWVNDQVLTSQRANAVKVRVGTGPLARGGSSVTELSTSGVHLGRQSGLSVLSGNLLNRSAKTAIRVPVYAVALRAGKVVAAGRAVAGTVPSNAREAVAFQIFLIGDPTGATIELTVPPTVP
jgi:hypothetical protein